MNMHISVGKINNVGRYWYVGVYDEANKISEGLFMYSDTRVSIYILQLECFLCVSGFTSDLNKIIPKMHTNLKAFTMKIYKVLTHFIVNTGLLT